MSSGASPIASEATPQPLSQGGRVLNAFFSPAKTFADIRRSHSWWAPFLLISLAASAFVVTVDKKVGFDVIAAKAMDRMPEFMKNAMQQVPPEQRQARLERQLAGQRFFGTYLSWISVLISGLIVAALVMVAFNFVLEAGVPFNKSLAVVFYAWLPKVVYCLLAIAVMLKGVDPDGFEIENPVTTNLAFLLDPSTSSRFLYHLLSGIDVIAAWEVCLMGMGFAMVANKKITTASGITTVAVMYGIYLLIRSVLPF